MPGLIVVDRAADRPAGFPEVEVVTAA